MNRLLPFAVPGYGATTALLLVLAPFLLLSFAIGLLVILSHVFLGSALVLGSLVESGTGSRWKGRGVLVSAAAYALGLGALFFGSTLEVPFFVAWLILTFSFPVLVVCVDWNRVLSSILGGQFARHGLWLILGIALLVRLPFYLSPVRLSSDFTAYSFYASRMAAGAVPYRDVFIPYTPGFTLLLQAVAWLGLTPALRLLLALPDVLIVVVLSRWPLNDPERSTRAMAWALFPAVLVEVAWSSHLDGLVAFLLLLCCLPLVGRTSVRGATLGFASAVRPFCIGAVPSILLGFSAARRAVVFLLSFTLLLGAFGLFYVGQLSGLVGGAVSYQLTRGAYNSAYFFVNWYASGGAAGYSAGPLFPNDSYLLTIVTAASFLAVNVAILAFRVHRDWLLRWYGVAISIMFTLWALMVLFFPLTFVGRLPVSPAWPNYRPVVFDVGLGMTLAAFGVVMARECYRMTSEDLKRAAMYLLALNMSLFVLLVPVYYAWYLLWVAPAILFLAPRRLVAVALVVLLASAPISYYASDFNSLGSQVASQTIPAGDFVITAVDRPLGGPMPVGTYSVNGSRGELYLSTAGNLTISAPTDIDPSSHPLLTFNIWSDHQSIGWNRERVWVWVIGQTASGSGNVSFVAVADDPNQFVTGHPYVVNLLYTGFTRVTSIRLRFDNWDTGPHRIWIGDVAAFDEYA